MPASVNISTSSEWGVLPFRITTSRAPRSIASTTERSFGTMPPSSEPELSSSRASASVICDTRLEASRASRYSPSTSVRYTSLSAWSASATLPAATSAFTL